jgi:hypothetical protein
VRFDIPPAVAQSAYTQLSRTCLRVLSDGAPLVLPDRRRLERESPSVEHRVQRFRFEAVDEDEPT